MPRKQNENAALSKLQKKFKKDIPQCLLEMLVASGFDTEFGIKNIDEESLKTIEVFFTENSKLLESIQVPEYYKSSTPFKFLPGHKLLLLKLAERLNVKENHPPDAVNVNIDDLIVQLEGDLIKKMVTYSTKRNFCIDAENFNATSLKDTTVIITNGVATGKCILTCPMCKKDVSVRLKKYWYSANFEKHIQAHGTFRKNNEEAEAEVVEQQRTQENTTNPQNNQGIVDGDIIFVNDSDTNGTNINTQLCGSDGSGGSTVVRTAVDILMEKKTRDCLNNLPTSNMIILT